MAASAISPRVDHRHQWRDDRPKGLARLAKIKPESLPLVRGTPRIGACVANPQKFIAIGLNYSDHAAESNLPVPPEPVVFTKQVSCISGPNDDVTIPPKSKKSDWEVELGVIIGTRAKNIKKKDALAHVAGYCTINDLSEREFQAERAGQWTKGKSYDTFGPIGPWLVTTDEVKDPQKLNLWLELNGKRVQDGTTATMVFGVAPYRRLSLAVLHPDAGRHHHHRHAARRRHGHEAAALPEARRYHAHRHRRARHPAAEGGQG